MSKKKKPNFLKSSQKNNSSSFKFIRKTPLKKTQHDQYIKLKNNIIIDLNEINKARNNILPPKKERYSFINKKEKDEETVEKKMQLRVAKDTDTQGFDLDTKKIYTLIDKTNDFQPTEPLDIDPKLLNLRQDLYQLYLQEKLPFPSTGNTDTGIALQPDVEQNTADIAALDVRVTTNELDIATLQAATMDFPIVFDTYIEQNQRGVNENVHGTFDIDVTGDTLASGDSIVFTKGRGKIFFVINAGADTSGTLTVTGTSVDRNTAVQTGSDTENVVIDGTTTDNSGTDDNGNTTHSFVNGYLTSKWWTGSLTISTTDLDISDIDIYHVSFEQVNDQNNITLRTFDINVKPTNTAAYINAHLYLIEKTTINKADVTLVRNLQLSAADVVANKAYRLRYGDIDQVFDGTGEGVWVELHFGPPAQNYITDFSMKIWFDINKSLSP